MNRLYRSFIVAIVGWGLGAAAQQNSTAFELGSISTPRTINPAANSTTPSSLAGQQQNPFLGSVPTGVATAEPLDLPFEDAIARGLRYNLGVIENQASLRQAQAQRLRTLSTMIPSVSGLLRQNLDDLNRVAIGLNIPAFPAATGQFGYQEAYLTFSDTGLNLNSVYQYKASRLQAESQRYSLEDAANVVALAVGTAYLQVEASESRVGTAKAELDSARELDEQATNRVKSGLAAEIEGFRAGVQYQTAQQRLTVATANLEKDKLTLARLIGLPSGQKFNATGKANYLPWSGGDLQAALLEARDHRADVKSADSASAASQLSKKAAQLERVPGVTVNGYYGSIGKNLGRSDATYSLAATVSLPIFTGGRIRSDIHDASATADRRQAEHADLLGRVDFEVRNAFTDLEAADSAVKVAEKNAELAQRTLDQARDRFLNGVTNNLEVIQAQQDVAAANENYISSLFAHNLAKLTLLRAMGSAQKDLNKYLGGN
ncbi:MAG TPA: TolC family protein [Candidatus Limnocylindrales bacterium]|nr:TolC family protein [Candidatus Limnocylindrales bacterium]